MKKIKYQGGLTKRLMSQRAQKSKKKFAQLVDRDLGGMLRKFSSRRIEMDVASFSSSRDFYDQIFSILSFLRYVGEPLAWHLNSDGSHSEKQVNLLRTHFPFVVFTKFDFTNVEAMKQVIKPVIEDYSSELLHYANAAPYGKKLFYYLNLPVKNPTLFIDSDILFYQKASTFYSILKEETSGWFLPDQVWGCLDSNYKRNNSAQPYQVNAGFFLLNRELSNLSPGMTFLRSLEGKYENFSEQTIFHILLRENGQLPLDPRIFILDSSDQFDFSYIKNRTEMAARHYTGPVRHKMWQRDWKWHLELD